MSSEADGDDPSAHITVDAAQSGATPQGCASRDELQQNYRNANWIRGATLRHGVFDGAQISGAAFEGADLEGANFQRVDLSRADLRNAKARFGRFSSANLSCADLRLADLRDAEFLSAALDGADLRGARFTPHTKLSNASVVNARIDRQSLRMLGPNMGGLTLADVATMKVEDDQAKLVVNFGGYWSAIHLLAAAIFFFPYVAFATQHYVLSLVQPCTIEVVCRPLWEATLRYALSNGYQDHTLTIAIFWLLVAYNVFRVTLVYKAQTLQWREESTGVPQHFSLWEPPYYWGIAYYACSVLLWVNLALVLYHSYGYLQTPVPA